MTPRQREIAEMIIEAVNLEDTQVEDIDPQAPIFNEGLGLDSIDALEISLELNKRYGLKVKSSDENVSEIFSSVASMAEYVDTHQTA